MIQCKKRRTHRKGETHFSLNGESGSGRGDHSGCLSRTNIPRSFSGDLDGRSVGSFSGFDVFLWLQQAWL